MPLVFEVFRHRQHPVEAGGLEHDADHVAYDILPHRDVLAEDLDRAGLNRQQRREQAE